MAWPRLQFALGALVPLSLMLPGSPTRADCTLSPGPGNDSHVCSSGSAPSLTDTAGNNSLTFPAAGTGAITGNVTFGAGNDRVLMESGSIGGSLAQGPGRRHRQPGDERRVHPGSGQPGRWHR